MIVLFTVNSRVKFNTKTLPSKKSHFIKKSALRNLGKEFLFNFDIENKLNSLKLVDCDKNDSVIVDQSSKPSLDQEDNVTMAVSNGSLLPSNNSFRFNFHIE